MPAPTAVVRPPVGGRPAPARPAEAVTAKLTPPPYQKQRRMDRQELLNWNKGGNAIKGLEIEEDEYDIPTFMRNQAD